MGEYLIVGTYGAARRPVCIMINNVLLIHFYYHGMTSLCFINKVKRVVYHIASYMIYYGSPKASFFSSLLFFYLLRKTP